MIGGGICFPIKRLDIWISNSMPSWKKIQERLGLSLEEALREIDIRVSLLLAGEYGRDAIEKDEQ